jgi:acyl-CoA thioester hydrolase
MTLAHGKLVLVEHVPMRWGDMDALGHVNNTVYFRYMEQARIRWFEQLGGLYQGDPPRGAVIVNAACTFRRPLVYPGTVEVRMYLRHPGRTSVDSHYELLKDGALHAEGSAKMVWIDLRSGKSVPLPQSVRALTGGEGE